MKWFLAILGALVLARPSRPTPGPPCRPKQTFLQRQHDELKRGVEREIDPAYPQFGLSNRWKCTSYKSVHPEQSLAQMDTRG